MNQGGQFETIQTWHVEIRHQNIEGFRGAAENAQGLARGLAGDGLTARQAAKDLCRERENGWIVINHQAGM